MHAFCHDFKDADQEVKDQMLIAAALWGRIEPQLLVLRRTAASLGERYLKLQDEMLERLEAKLKNLVTRVEKLLTMPSFQKYVADRLPPVEVEQEAILRQPASNITDLSTQEVQICFVLEEPVAEICAGFRRLVPEMGSLLVLDCPSCFARY